jgi:hypothetical protein
MAGLRMIEDSLAFHRLLDSLNTIPVNCAIGKYTGLGRP